MKNVIKETCLEEEGDEAANIVSKHGTPEQTRNVRWREEVIAQAVFNRFPDHNQKCSASP